MTGKIDYSKLALPKVRPQGPSWRKAGVQAPATPPARPPRRKAKGTAKRRAKKRTRTLAVAADDRQVVFTRQHHTCFAVLVSPVCTRTVQDPHELVPVGVGGKRVSRNRVGLCRADHQEAQGRVGGNRLVFDWPGKDAGEPPNADVLGNVTVTWVA